MTHNQVNPIIISVIIIIVCKEGVSEPKELTHLTNICIYKSPD